MEEKEGKVILNVIKEKEELLLEEARKNVYGEKEENMWDYAENLHYEKEKSIKEVSVPIKEIPPNDFVLKKNRFSKRLGAC